LLLLLRATCVVRKIIFVSRGAFRLNKYLLYQIRAIGDRFIPTPFKYKIIQTTNPGKQAQFDRG
jgi:hypothetical protein